MQLPRQMALGIVATLAVACGGSDGGELEGSGAAGGTAGTAGGAGAAGSGGDAASSGSGGAPAEGMGCGVPLFARPTNPGEHGPWTVGARTVQVGALVTEVWYPSAPGSTPSENPVVYDLRQWLPPAERGKIPDADSPWQACDCWRDLPLDEAHGPYPVIVFMHGTAAFRTQSLSLAVHWASRGFVVLAADHPGLFLGDSLSFMLANDLPRDGHHLLDALDPPAADLAFLAGRIDLGHVGMAGHSAGGRGVSTFGSRPGVRALVPMAAGGTVPGSALESTLVMGALNDKVVAYAQQVAGYDGSPAAKRLVGLANAGHLAFSDLCDLVNTEGQDLVAIAMEHGIQNAQFASLLWDGCSPGQLDTPTSTAIVRYATAAVFEEVLQCSSAGEAFASMRAAFPSVAEVREAP